MNTETKLPADVLEAIHANRKIDAIKLLREHRGLGLKEAKHEVEAYARKNPHMIPDQPSGSGAGRLTFVIFVVAVVYLLYQQFGNP